MSKQYGLIVPNKSKPSAPNIIIRPSIFDDNSDSDNEFAKPTGLKQPTKRQDRLLQEKAVEEDPTVYQYDELYDDMDKQRKESKLSRKDLDKKPKYINKLLASAERRKREYERRIEKDVQKDREAEGEQFKDKESFVTTAYRKKLEEMKELDEKEQREEYLETIGDVTKQGNLDGFYRHLYDQKVLYEEKTAKDSNAEADVKEECKSPSEEREKEAPGPSKEATTNKSPKGSKKRKYRRRESSDSETDKTEEMKQIKVEHLPSNIDADSDFSIDSSDSDEDAEKKKQKGANAVENPVAEEAENNDKIIDEKPKIIGKEEVTSAGEEESLANGESKAVEVVKKPKIDIWKKRTVGVLFDEALQRYFERKALKEQNLNT